MKKRSMLAVASLAVGVVASLTAPNAHAGSADTGSRSSGILTPDTLPVPDQATGDNTADDADR
ncbi:hypothetical protein [Kitasatospora sp. GP82]|uniref:hypothetical protein n=1 Tax=Kitasatospora sp. GP82 TaxID=3035089 RepID=UPI002475FC0B|nr:hypothetical protein [Kitasatospora sp. GP82]MDH6126411.1 hypothetical protein [Kitasatospora sp. GP82]